MGLLSTDFHVCGNKSLIVTACEKFLAVSR